VNIVTADMAKMKANVGRLTYLTNNRLQFGALKSILLNFMITKLWWHSICNWRAHQSRTICKE